MLAMMIGFFKGLWQYRTQVKKQHKWIVKYTAQKNYALNPSWMMSTNLEIWLSEMEATFGKRYCPCFEPSGDAKLDKQMMYPASSSTMRSKSTVPATVPYSAAPTSTKRAGKPHPSV